jgi:hypothetical protein
VKAALRFLFAGGIIDPTYQPYVLRAVAPPPSSDFGVISIARNPFAEDDSVVAILVAGFHMFGTAHAIRMLSQRTDFETHPYGGVLRVNYNQGDGFALRFDNSTARWDTDSDYTRETLLDGLRQLSLTVPRHINDQDPAGFEHTKEFVESL